MGKYNTNKNGNNDTPRSPRPRATSAPTRLRLGPVSAYSITSNP